MTIIVHVLNGKYWYHYRHGINLEKKTDKATVSQPGSSRVSEEEIAGPSSSQTPPTNLAAEHTIVVDTGSDKSETSVSTASQSTIMQTFKRLKDYEGKYLKSQFVCLIQLMLWA